MRSWHGCRHGLGDFLRTPLVSLRRARAVHPSRRRSPRDAIHRAVAATTAAVTVTGRGVQARPIGSESKTSGRFRYLADLEDVRRACPPADVLVESARHRPDRDETRRRGFHFPVTETLGDLVRSDPQRLLAISRGASWSSAAKKISLTAEGVFLADRKISEWSSLLIRIGKVDVVEGPHRQTWRLRTAVSSVFSSATSAAASSAGWSSTTPIISISPYVGGVIGGVAGAIWFTRDARD
jgi:hypothetical protein